MSTLVIDLPYTPTAKQLEAARACSDPSARVISMDGAYRSAKTQAAGRVLAEWAMQDPPAVYLVSRAGYRALKDSTQRAMLHGDGSLPPLIPPEAIAQYRASDEAVYLHNGSEILFRSLEETNVEKLRGLTLGGILVDQIEELDEGPAGERVFDTLLGRLSDPRGPRKLIAISNPAGLTHWVYRRLVNAATRDRGVRHVQFRLTDNAQNLPADYVAEMLATKETRPHWYRSFVEGVWGAFAGMAYAEFDPAVHVVDPFPVPAEWERFESMDHGAASPTAWLLWAVDHDGNVLIADEYYVAGETVSSHAAAILGRRRGWRSETCWGDPSVWGSQGITGRWGQPASVGTEYAERGIHLLRANNDRAAGYMRLLELMRVAPGRLAPPWARIPGHAGGAPRLYVSSRCEHLIEQFRSAAVAETGTGAGQCVDPAQESAHLHAHAAARYGALTRPAPTPTPAPTDLHLVPPPPPDELRAEALSRYREQRDKQPARGGRRRYLT